ncbi:MAG: ABC transporter ATP-binding protein [Gemmatimonadota bacterium]
MDTVIVEHVAKRFDETAVVRDVSLTVAEGEVMALLGPSGSGKTTMLRLIAGFESPDAGRILLSGRDVTGVSAVDRRCGMVFQHYALFPHLSVGENVAYGLAGRQMDGAARMARVSEALALVDLTGYASRAVTALSGGQQQRVALARALAPEPAVLLLDEPLSNLDPSLRERTRRELRELVRRIGITTILVTHEQEEAFELADRVALLLNGVLEQVGSPEDLYGHPATPAVAGFIGRVMAVPGTVVSITEGEAVVRALGTTLGATARGLEVGAKVDLLLRPEALVIDPAGTIAGVVEHRRFVGARDLLLVRCGELDLEVLADPMSAAVGSPVHLSPSGVGAHAFGTGT